MSQGNYESAYCEILHSYILEEFHVYRKSMNMGIEVTLNGSDLANIIANAKKRLYKEKPEAKNAGFKEL